jgi:AcrR family transcriptional regulator
MFLERSYNGVRVEDIVADAAVSRATFYVYFPSKRDVFLALGIDSIQAGFDVLDTLESMPTAFSDSDLANFIGHYLEYLEHYGAFVKSWDEVTADDPVLKRDSQYYVERFCRRLGLALDRLRGWPDGDATLQGAALRGSIDGVWYFWRVRDLPHERDEIIQVLASLVRRHLA